MNRILNLTQHTATVDQLAAGVVELTPEAKRRIVELLTFETIPTPFQVRGRSYEIAGLAAWEFIVPPTETTEGVRYTHAMIGGAPYLMAPLESALRAHGITPVYAFSVRESIDQPQPDGSVRKVATFRHAGFVGCEIDEPETIEVLSESEAARYRVLPAQQLTATKAKSVTALFGELQASDDAYNLELTADGFVGRFQIENYLQFGRTAEVVAICRDGVVYQF